MAPRNVSRIPLSDFAKYYGLPLALALLLASCDTPTAPPTAAAIPTTRPASTAQATAAIQARSTVAPKATGIRPTAAVSGPPRPTDRPLNSFYVVQAECVFEGVNNSALYILDGNPATVHTLLKALVHRPEEDDRWYGVYAFGDGRIETGTYPFTPDSTSVLLPIPLYQLDNVTHPDTGTVERRQAMENGAGLPPLVISSFVAEGRVQSVQCKTGDEQTLPANVTYGP